jgi:hypothetical protein
MGDFMIIEDWQRVERSQDYGADNPARGIELHTLMGAGRHAVDCPPYQDRIGLSEAVPLTGTREKFSGLRGAGTACFGVKMLVDRGFGVGKRKWRGFRGLRLFFTCFSPFFTRFSCGSWLVFAG